MKTNNKEIFIFDNNGETFDRYTIILKEDASIYGSSENPFHPQGFGQYCGETHKDVNEYINDAQKDPTWLGKEITDINELPINVQKYINLITE